MDFISQMVEKAKRSPKSIVFPESCEDKVLQAARRVLELGIAHPVLVGAPARVEEAARAAGVPVAAVVGDIGDCAEAALDLGVSGIFSINRVAVPFSQAKLRSKDDMRATAANLFRFMERLGL